MNIIMKIIIEHLLSLGFHRSTYLPPLHLHLSPSSLSSHLPPQVEAHSWSWLSRLLSWQPSSHFLLAYLEAEAQKRWSPMFPWWCKHPTSSAFCLCCLMYWISVVCTLHSCSCGWGCKHLSLTDWFIKPVVPSCPWCLQVPCCTWSRQISRQTWSSVVCLHSEA